MADKSYTGWRVVLTCDHPKHKRKRGWRGPEMEPDITDEGQLFSSILAYRTYYRRLGYIFHHFGKVTCPECRKADEDARQSRREARLAAKQKES